MSVNYKKLGDYITQRREKNTAINLPICGVCREGLIPPKQQDADISLYNVFYKNDFIFNPARMELNSITLNTEYDKAICSSLYEIFYINNTSKLLPEFLFVQLKTDNFVRFCEFQGQGSVREYCRFANISEYPVIVPDIKEQQKIVNTYNAITKRIKIKQKINENLEKTAQCLFDKMWESEESLEVELSELAELTSSKRVFFDEYVPEGIPFYRGGEITEKRQGIPISNPLYITEESYNEKIEKYGVPNTGDILITAVGTIGNSYMVTENDKFYFKDGNLIWFRNFQKNSNYIIYDFLNSRQFKNKIEQISIGSTQTALTISGLSKIKIRIPNNANYHRYIEQSEVILNSVQRNNAELGNLYCLKNILISQISKR